VGVAYVPKGDHLEWALRLEPPTKRHRSPRGVGTPPRPPRQSSGTMPNADAIRAVRWWAVALLLSLLTWIGLILASLALL